MFGDCCQHDAHELLQCLLTHVDDVITSLRHFSTSPLSALHTSPSQRAINCSFSQATDAVAFMPVISFASSHLQQLPSYLGVSRSYSQANDVLISLMRSSSSRPVISSASSPLLLPSRQVITRSLSKASFTQTNNVLISKVTSSSSRPLQQPPAQQVITRSLTPANANLSQSGNVPVCPDTSSPSSPRMSCVSSLLQQSPSHLSITRSLSRASDASNSPVMSSSSPHLLRSLQTSRLLSPVVNGRYGHSLPSSQCTNLVVDLCMPRKYKSLGASLNFAHWQSSNVVVSPDLFCDRLNRKRECPSLSLTHSQSPVVNGHHRKSLPSSLCTDLVVDLCMPRKCKSLGALPNSAHQQSSTVVVSPDLLCDRLKRKRECPSSSSTHSQQVPMKCEKLENSYCLSSFIDNNCEPSTCNCLHDSFIRCCSQTCKSSDELPMCGGSGDGYQGDCEQMQSIDDTKLACNTLHSLTYAAVSAPLTDSQCSLKVFEQAVTQYTSLSAKDELLLALRALENGRSCYVSLCRENISVPFSRAASFYSCLLNNVKTCMKSGNVDHHVGRVRDMFDGQMITKTKCLKCGFVASHLELYKDVALFTGHCVRNRMLSCFIHDHM